MINPRLLPFLFPAILLAACADSQTRRDAAMSASGEGGDDPASIEALMERTMAGVEPVKYHEFIDPNNGMVQARYPIPKSWTVHAPDAPVYIEGPGQVRVYKSETRSMVWSDNPMMQQTLQMNGQNLARPLNARQVLEQFVRPNAEGQGYRLTGNTSLPEVAGLWERLMHAMPNTGSQRGVEALGADFDTDKGTKSLIVIVLTRVVKQQTVFWSVQTTELEAREASFIQARNAYLYSLANAQLNPAWIRRMNGELAGNIRKTEDFWAKATAESTAAHQQRMSAIAARGQAALSIGNTYSDILDISHKGYLNRSAINDAGHDKLIRSINETTLIGNHETGEHYSVDSGSKYYWVSNDGTYVGTDNALFDPNINQGMNDKDWTKFAVEE